MTQARNLPQWTGATLFNRPLSDLSDSPPLSLSVISMVLDLLTPPPLPFHIVSFYLLHFVTNDLLLCPGLTSSSFSFSLCLSFDFLSLSVSLSQVYCLISSVLFVLCPRGQHRAPRLSHVSSLTIAGCIEVFNPPVL